MFEWFVQVVTIESMRKFIAIEKLFFPRRYNSLCHTHNGMPLTAIPMEFLHVKLFEAIRTRYTRTSFKAYNFEMHR